MKFIKKQIQFLVPLALLVLMSMTNPNKTTEQLPNRKTQVKINNESNFYRTIRLWGGYDLTNFCSINTDALDELEVQETINTAITGLRKLVYNPYNDLIYVLQNSNEVLLYTSDGIFVGTVTLTVGSFPTDIVIQKSTSSVNYGKAYISSTNPNTLTVIDSDFFAA